MPNHVKNRIVIIGSDDRVKELIEKYTTHHERKPHRVYDGDLLYKKGEYTGWFNEETNVFRMRKNYNDPITVHDGVQDGFELEYQEAWSAMPDFQKIFPEPEGMDISIHSGIESAVKKKLGLSYWGTPKDRSELNKDEQVLFDQAVKNYQEHGYMYWYDWRNEHWGTKWGGYNYEQINDNTFEFDTAWSGVPDMIYIMGQEFPDLTIEYLWSDEDTGANCGKFTFVDGEDFETEIENGSKEAYEIAFDLRPENRDYYNLVDGEYVYHDEDEEEEDEE